MRADEWCAGGNALVGGFAADKSKESLAASTEGGLNGFCVRFHFFGEVCESRVGRIADDFRQRGMLEVGFPIVYLGGARHCLVGGSAFVV